MVLRMICRPKGAASYHLRRKEKEPSSFPLVAPNPVQTPKTLPRKGENPTHFPFVAAPNDAWRRIGLWGANKSGVHARRGGTRWRGRAHPRHGKGDGARWIQVIWRWKTCFPAPNDAGDTGRGRSERSERSSAPTGYRPSGPKKPPATPAAPKPPRGRGRR